MAQDLNLSPMAEQLLAQVTGDVNKSFTTGTNFGGVDKKMSNFLTSIPYGFMVPSTNSKPYIPNIRPHTVINLKKNGKNVEINRQLAQELYDLSENYVSDSKRGVFPILSPFNLMHRPAISPINFLNCILMRTVNNPYPKISDYDQFLERVKNNWECITKETITWYPEDVVDDYTIVTACANMSAPKRRRILEADKNAQQKGDFYSQAKSISIKHDELLSAKTIQDTLSIKPRAIVQFSPIFIARQTTYAHTYSDLLHAMYNTSRQYRVYNKL